MSIKPFTREGVGNLYTTAIRRSYMDLSHLLRAASTIGAPSIINLLMTPGGVSALIASRIHMAGLYLPVSGYLVSQPVLDEDGHGNYGNTKYS